MIQQRMLRPPLVHTVPRAVVVPLRVALRTRQQRVRINEGGLLVPRG